MNFVGKEYTTTIAINCQQLFTLFSQVFLLFLNLKYMPAHALRLSIKKSGLYFRFFACDKSVLLLLIHEADLDYGSRHSCRDHVFYLSCNEYEVPSYLYESLKLSIPSAASSLIINITTPS